MIFNILPPCLFNPYLIRVASSFSSIKEPLNETHLIWHKIKRNSINQCLVKGEFIAQITQLIMAAKASTSCKAAQRAGSAQCGMSFYFAAISLTF